MIRQLVSVVVVLYFLLPRLHITLLPQLYSSVQLQLATGLDVTLQITVRFNKELTGGT